MPRLPIVNASQDGIDLLKSFAESRGMEFSAAIRMIISESPSLQQYAKRHGRVVNLEVQRGGRRIPKDVQAELDRLRNQKPD